MSQDNHPVSIPSVDQFESQFQPNETSAGIKLPSDELQQKTVVRVTQNNPISNSPSSNPLQQWVSQFQTTLDISPAPTRRKEYPNIMDNDNAQPSTNTLFTNVNNNKSININQRNGNLNEKLTDLESAAKKETKRTAPIEIKPSQNLPTLIPKSLSPGNLLVKGVSREPLSITSDQLKQFQTSFQLSPTQSNYNKTSINAIINFDADPEIKPEAALQKEKKKRAPKKKIADENETQASKKRKTEKSTDLTDTTSIGMVNSTGVKATSESPKKKKSMKPKQLDSKTHETKKQSKVKKKASETPPIEDSSKVIIHPAMTTERIGARKDNILLPSPAIIDVNNQKSPSLSNILDFEGKILKVVNDKEIPSKEKETERDEETEKEKEKEKAKEKEKEKKEVSEPPIIAINIPLLDPSNPKPGQSEVVINVLKLAEDKYGWSVVHPNAKSAIDLMDEIIDDEEDGMEDDAEEEELPIADDQAATPGNSLSKKKKGPEEDLTEEQLARRHEVKMNRKVGKYDYEDPFIDDEELQWEEEITSTKDGFFVYWGPLIDDRNNTVSSKKASSKSKK